MLNGLLDILFPPCCAYCDAAVLRDQVLCTSCSFKLPYIAQKYNDQHPAQIRFQYRTNIQEVYASFYLSDNSMMSTLMHAFKYKYRKHIGLYFAQLAIDDIKTNAFPIQAFDAIIPIPLHPKKEKNRGFNQSYVIGNAIGKHFDIPLYQDYIIKHKHTASQTSKTRLERIENMQNVFSLKNHYDFSNKKILIVDDILTTGATLESCINCIYNSTSTDISIYTLALADF